jgi:DNA replication protein DnaC
MPSHHHELDLASDTGIERRIGELIAIGDADAADDTRESVDAAIDPEAAERYRQRCLAFRRFRDAAGPHIAQSRFATFVLRPGDDYQATVFRTSREWSNTFPHRQREAEGMVLFGPVGTGKDHLAFAAVGQALVDHDVVFSAHWLYGRDFFGTVRDRIDSHDSEATLLRRLESIDVLVVSDPLPPFGDLTPFQADTFYRLVEARYARRKITICTLNVATDDEADRRLGAATWDRLCHRSWKMHCCWPSFRQPARELKPPRTRSP